MSIAEFTSRSIWLASVAAVGSGIIASGIASGVDRNASIIVVWLSYLLAVAIIALAAGDQGRDGVLVCNCRGCWWAHFVERCASCLSADLRSAC